MQIKTTTTERQFNLRQNKAVHMFRSSLPDRFRDVTMDSFQISKQEAEKQKQLQVITRLRGIIDRIDEFCSGPYQLFIWGRVGTGKDHLSVSVAKHAGLAGYSARWVDAANLFDNMAQFATKGEAIKRALEPDILILSDAVCNRSWSEAKQSALRRIANDRWSKRKATWCTVNVTSVFGNEPNSAESLMVKDTLDRLLDNSAVIHCDWSSYRTKRGWR